VKEDLYEVGTALIIITSRTLSDLSINSPIFTPMPRFNIHHITKYTYEGPVRDSANQIILFPIKDEYQEVLHQELTITGEPPSKYTKTIMAMK
jgi:hypothetical protein